LIIKVSFFDKIEDVTIVDMFEFFFSGSSLEPFVSPSSHLFYSSALMSCTVFRLGTF